MAQQDQRISEAIERDRARVRNFIRSRVPDPADAEDILQDVFYELVEAYRMMRPITQVTAWLFSVARNRITDRFRKKKFEAASESTAIDDDGEPLLLAELLPSSGAGPDSALASQVLAEELDAALDELPEDQREVFVAHEIDGFSFKEIAARTGVNVNTLLSRKHNAVLHLRRRLEAIYDEYRRK